MKYILTSNKGFYIGDISYVLSDEVYHDVWGNQNSYQDGKIQVGSYAFAVDRTAYGDGYYLDNNGGEYSVDAGVIGCVPFELIDMDKLHENYDLGANLIDVLNDFGLFVEGSQAEFKTDDEGVFTITIDNQITIIIDTNYEEGYEEDDEDSEEYDEQDDEEEYFEEYDGEEAADEQFNEPISNSNIEKVLSQAQYNPDMFQIHGTGEINYSGVTVKFIYYANPRKPLNGTYIDIDSTDKGFEKVFKGHLNKYLPEDEVCRIILRQLTDYLDKSTNQQPAKESISDEVLSKLDSFDADQGNYPLEGASIYYDSQYLRFYFEGVDETTAKNKVLSFLFAQGFDVNKSQLYATKYGSSVTIFLRISSLPTQSSAPVRDPRGGDSGAVIYPDDFPLSQAEIDVVRTIVVKDLTKPITEDYFSIFPNLKTAKILGTVKTVYGFANCKNLTNVKIEEGVAGIGENAFIENKRLMTIALPNSLASIGECAFGSCTGLGRITLPRSMTKIEPYTFSDCNRLTSIEIPNSITSIGTNAFEYCGNIENIEIPDSVTSIGDYAFSECYKLKDVTIPNSVTSIGEGAFFNCENLETITFGKNSRLTSISNSAFFRCSSLTNITIPNSVTSIGWSAFFECLHLRSITIPNSVTIIGYRAFYDCSSLIAIHYNGTKSQWQSIEKEEEWDFFVGEGSYRIICTDGTITLN